MVVDWIEQHITSAIRYVGTGDEIHICCPVCGDTRYRLYINLFTGQVYCHNCQFKGTVVNLIQQVEGIPYQAAKRRFGDIKGNIVLPESVERTLRQRLFAVKSPLVQKRAVPLPEEFQLLSQCDNHVAHQAIRYLHHRGVTDTQIEKHHMGICATGDYTNRIIIPIYHQNELVFWVARAMSLEVKLKERSPTNSFYQHSKSEVIFNLHEAATNYHSVVISEGIFDALSWGGIGVSLLGKVLYDAQLNLLLQYRTQLTEGVYVALDADAETDAMTIATTLSEIFPVKLVHIPPEFDDPNNYLMTHSRAAMWQLLSGAEPLGEFTSLRHRLQHIL